MSDESTAPSIRDAIEAAFNAVEGPADQPAQATPVAAVADRPEDATTTAPDDFDAALGFDRDAWSQTPAQARERAKQLAKEAREAAERARKYEPIEALLAPRRDAWRIAYGDESKALEHLLALSDFAARDPAAFLRHVADARGIDPRMIWPDRFGEPNEPPQPATPLDPRNLETLVERKLMERETMSTLAAFDRDERYEFRHDPEIRRIMAGLLNAGAANDLETAYSIAVRAHEPTRAKLDERARAERAKREAEEAAKRAQEQAAATATVRGAPGRTNGAAQTVDPSNLRAVIESAWNQAAGRV